MILKPTCFKGLFRSTTELILANHKQSFMKSHVYQTGVSDHYKMIFSVVRKTFAKGKSKTVFLLRYKNYDQNFSNKVLQNKISQPDLSEEFLEILQSTLDLFAPYKQKRLDITTILSWQKVLEKNS